MSQVSRARTVVHPDHGGLVHLPQFFDLDGQRALFADVAQVVAAAPLFKPTMPRTGRPFSVLMTNCGSLGWVSDKVGGYRYQDRHPETGAPWPPIPRRLIAAWRDVAGYPAEPEACLVNIYGAGARMGSHQDRDEADFSAPVLSVSLGDDATFHVGGRKRSDTKTRFTLRSGDVLVLGGESRLAFHGVDKVHAGTSPLDLSAIWPGALRVNLTLRRVSPP